MTTEEEKRLKKEKKEKKKKERENETPEQKEERRRRRRERRERREKRRQERAARKEKEGKEGKEKKKKKKDKKKEKKKERREAKERRALLGVTGKENIFDHYILGELIGQGAFSRVFKSARKEDPAAVFAIKCIQKSILQGEDLILLKREVENLKKMDHPNIIKLYEVFEDEQNFYLVMEFVNGKELFEKIIDRGNYSERDASNITRQIVSAIGYLHSMGIAHRDLKPENLLSTGDGMNELIKVADFGLSKDFDKDKLSTSCGSPGYVAPEVLMCDTYDKSVDMWSIGVILYILLCGYPPFYADTDPALFKKIMAVEYDFNGEGWSTVSDQAKDLIKHLLVQDPKNRYTAEQVLNHPWIKDIGSLGNQQLQMGKLQDQVKKK